MTVLPAIKANVPARIERDAGGKFHAWCEICQKEVTAFEFGRYDHIETLGGGRGFAVHHHTGMGREWITLRCHGKEMTFGRRFWPDGCEEWQFAPPWLRDRS